MLYEKISGTDMNVSKILLGVSGETPFALLDAYAAAGGNMPDTARLYDEGRSEENLGRWLRARGNRNSVYVATKCAHHDLQTGRKRLSRADIFADADASLAALQVDTIDLLWLHRDDTARDAGEIIESLNELIRAGKVRYTGASNWRGKRIAEANAYAEAHGLSGFCASQIWYSAASWNLAEAPDPTLVAMDETEYAFYGETKTPVFAYASQAKGYFSKLSAGAALSEKAAARYDTAENRAKLEKMRTLAHETKTSVSAVTLAYLTSHTDFPCLPVIGSRSAEQLQDSLRFADLRLTAGDLEALRA
jgi:aryl-alcohol dehydrogenase-like predicted oxidoreductase